MGYSYHPYCEYCTEPETQNIDNDTAEIETATHILCNCHAFTEIRIEIYGEITLTPEQLFSSRSIKTNLKKIIKFMKKSKCFERKPKLAKRDLSPKRGTKKRKTNTVNTKIKRIKKKKWDNTTTKNKYRGKNNNITNKSTATKYNLRDLPGSLTATQPLAQLQQSEP